jgi:hypothetical protein
VLKCCVQVRGHGWICGGEEGVRECMFFSEQALGLGDGEGWFRLWASAVAGTLGLWGSGWLRR